MASSRGLSIERSPVQPLTTHSFRAMNTEVRMFSTDAAAGVAMRRAERHIAEFEERFSRFRPDSELSHLNRSSGRAFRVSSEMLSLLSLSATMRVRTNGVFDPSILPALEAAGYDRSFERVRSDQGAIALKRCTPRPRFAQMEIDTHLREVRLPDGMRLDLGGIGKGYVIERVLELFPPLPDVLIDAGGDILARGHGPDGDGWLVSIADPFAPHHDIAFVQLHDEAIATSTTMRRRWYRDGRVRHHLIDPRTGESADSGLAQVSVVAASPVEADVVAKCALILGECDGARLLHERDASAFFVRDDGTCSPGAGWPGEAQAG